MNRREIDIYCKIVCPYERPVAGVVQGFVGRRVSVGILEGIVLVGAVSFD